jgi:hypothetical protein
VTDTDNGAVWATVARETFEYSIVPWASRRFAEWVRAWSRVHPKDPRGLVQVPEDVFLAYQRRAPGERLSRQTAQELGYPSVPGEQELDRVRRELKAALGRCDWDEASELDKQLRELQERVAAIRVTALRPSSVPGI